MENSLAGATANENKSGQTSTPHRRRRWNGLWLLVLLAGFAGLYFTPFGDDLSYRLSRGRLGSGTDHPDREMIERIGRLRLPPSAAGIQARVEGCVNRTMWLRFECPSAELPQFRCELIRDRGRFERRPDVFEGRPTQIGGLYHAWDPSQFRVDPVDRPWWKPMSAKHALVGNDAEQRGAQTVIVDRADLKVAVVYVVTRER